MKTSLEPTPISQFSRLCSRVIDTDDLNAFQQSFDYKVPAKEDAHTAALKFIDQTEKLSKEVNILEHALKHNSYKIILFVLEQVTLAKTTSYAEKLKINEFINLLNSHPAPENGDIVRQQLTCKYLLLHIAIQNSNLAAINALLSAIAAAENFDSLRYADCIRSATQIRNFDILIALFSIDHIVRHQAELQPLHLLIDCAFDYASVIEYCYRNFDIHLTDQAGNTPLHLAVARGHERTCAKLAQISNLNLKNQAGFMPMELAVQRAKYDKEDNDIAASLVRILVKAGGDIHGCVTFFNQYSETITLDGTQNLKQQLIQIEKTQIPLVLTQPIHHFRTRMYRFIALMGGGIKGRAYLPAIQEAVKRKLISLPEIEAYSGTSAGAITAFTFALNLPFPRLEEITNTTKFIDFIDFASPLYEFLKIELEKALSEKFDFTTIMKVIIINLKTIWHSWDEFNRYLGVCKGDVLYKFLCDRLSERLKDIPHLAGIDPTLITFRDLANHPTYFKKLVVYGSNLDTGLSERYSVDTSPDDAVVDDVFISGCIPYVWIPRNRYVVKINADGSRVREILQKTVLNKDGVIVKVPDLDIRVDGGLFYNFPIGAHDFDEHGKHKYNEDTLGFYLADEDQYDTFEYNKPRIEKLKETADPNKAETHDYGFFTLAGRLINVTMFNQQSLYQKLGADKNRTIYIDTLDINFVNFDLPVNKLNQLLAKGVEGVNNFIARQENIPDKVLSTPVATKLFNLGLLSSQNGLFRFPGPKALTVARVLKLYAVATPEEMPYLKTTKANPNLVQNGVTALQIARAFGMKKTAQRLIDCNANAHVLDLDKATIFERIPEIAKDKFITTRDEELSGIFLSKKKRHEVSYSNLHEQNTSKMEMTNFLLHRHHYEDCLRVDIELLEDYKDKYVAEMERTAWRKDIYIAPAEKHCVRWRRVCAKNILQYFSEVLPIHKSKTEAKVSKAYIKSLQRLILELKSDDMMDMIKQLPDESDPTSYKAFINAYICEIEKTIIAESEKHSHLTSSAPSLK